MSRSCRHAHGRMLLVTALAVGCVAGAAACEYPGGTTAATGTLATSPGTTPEDAVPGEDPSAPPGASTTTAATEAAGDGPSSSLTTSGDAPDTTTVVPEPSEPTGMTLLPGGFVPEAEGPPVATAPTGLRTLTLRESWGSQDLTAEATIVSERLQAFLTEVDKAKASGTTDRTSVRDLSQGSARAEIENSLVELEQEGYRQRGASKVLAVSVHRMNAPVQRLVVACIDDSAVEIVADNGYVVRPASKSPRASLHEYTMLRVARDWRVLKHDMPDDPDCRFTR